MRKIVGLVLAGCLTFSSCVFAADIDLSSLSDDELQALKGKVDLEMSNRALGESALLQEGVYVVGKDVKAGSYVFTGLVEGSVPEGDDLEDVVMPAQLFYFKSEDDHSDWNVDAYDYAEPGNPVRRSFEDGEVFEVSYQSVMATYSEPLPFAP